MIKEVKTLQKKIDAFLLESKESNHLNYYKKQLDKALRLLKNAQLFLKHVAPVSEKYNSFQIKKLLIDTYVPKSWIIDELTLNYEGLTRRFDVLMVEKYNQIKNRVIGFEIKTDINDLKKDSKFEDYLKFCHILYFVVPEKLKEEALLKIKSSSEEKHIGLYCVTNEYSLKLIKRGTKQKGLLIPKGKIIDKIKESAYNKYIYKTIHRV